MLSDFELAICRNNKIDPENVESITPNMVVTFKDGKRQQICEVWSRKRP